MMDKKRIFCLAGVIGLAVYASNLFVFLREDEWRIYLQSSLEAVKLSKLGEQRRVEIFGNSKPVVNRPRMSKTIGKEFVTIKNVNMTAKSEGKRVVNDKPLTHNGETSAFGKEELTIKYDKKAINGVRYNRHERHESYDEYLNRRIQQQVLRRKIRKEADHQQPLTHIGFLKVHKAYSTILQTLFFRFGYTRNVTFVLPVRGHYFSKTTDTHERLRSTPEGRPYELLCNHGYFNFSLYSSVLPRDSVYIAIVRDPFQQFVAAFNYYKTQFRFKYLLNLPSDEITNLILYSEIYEESWPLSYTMNSMANDFGFKEFHYRDYKVVSNTSSAHQYLERLGAIFDLVLVAEWLDQSLVLMKRQLNWSLKDILYIKRSAKSYVQERYIDKELLTIFKDRNRLDYLLYEYFLDSFKKKLETGGKSLEEETDHFTRTAFKVSEWCVDQYFGEYVVKATKWNKRFVINSQDCNLMLKSEMEFINLIQRHQS